MAATTPAHRHGGHLAVEVLRGHGVATMYTLSGGHVFPLYDAAAHGEPPLPIVDVRHEQSAVFAAEAEAKLRRTCGLAVLTAGPGVTNGVSGVATAHALGAPTIPARRCWPEALPRRRTGRGAQRCAR